MAIIYYGKVRRGSFIGLGAPGWVAVLLGGITIGLVFAIFFFSGTFAGGMAAKREAKQETEAKLQDREDTLASDGETFRALNSQAGNLAGRILRLEVKGQQLVGLEQSGEPRSKEPVPEPDLEWIVTRDSRELALLLGALDPVP